MPVDFGILAQTPSIGARYAEGMQMRQADAERNMLRQSQMQQMQLAQSRFKQEQEDRAYQLGERKKQAEREAQFQSVANLIRERGLDPDDPKVLGQFAEAALKAENPQLVSFVGQMAERAAKRRAAKEEASTIGDILSPRLPPGPPLRQEAAAPNALAAPVPAVNALAAPQQPQNLFAGTPFDIGMGMPAPAKAAAPMAAPAAAPVPVPPPVGGVLFVCNITLAETTSVLIITNELVPEPPVPEVTPAPPVPTTTCKTSGRNTSGIVSDTCALEPPPPPPPRADAAAPENPPPPPPPPPTA